MTAPRIEVTTARGAVYYPPFAAVAALRAPCHTRIGERTPAGAAVLVVAGKKPA